MESTDSRHGRRFSGTVTSVAGAKTVMVEVHKRMIHRTYGKYIDRVVKYMAHDETSACRVGDSVEIEECRPMSARKRWRVLGTQAKATAA